MTQVFAKIENRALSNELQAQDGLTFLNLFLQRMITLLVIVGGLVFFFMLLFGAIKWITSGGDKSQVEGARSQITNALIGLVILFSVWAIANLVETIFGINLIQVDLAPILV